MAIRDLTNLKDFFRFNCSNQILNSRFLGKKFIIYWIIITPEEQTCSRKQLISYCIFSSLPIMIPEDWWSIGFFLKNSATCRKILPGCVNSSFFKIMNLWFRWSNIVGKVKFYIKKKKKPWKYSYQLYLGRKAESCRNSF